MKARMIITLVGIFFVPVLTSSSSFAQCAMCTLNAESSVKGGNTQGKGLNTGILYLLAAPYIAVAGIGLIWYKQYRRKNGMTPTEAKTIHMN
jgi:hypothetical protein